MELDRATPDERGAHSSPVQRRGDDRRAPDHAFRVRPTGGPGGLGRGAGYYDRLLAHPEWRGFRCGLFFAAQETPSVPHEPWDIRLDAIVTEREVVR